MKIINNKLMFSIYNIGLFAGNSRGLCVKIGNREKGSVLVISLYVLLAMSVVAAGFTNILGLKWTEAGLRNDDTTNFQLAESCTNSMIGAFNESTETLSTSEDKTLNSPTTVASAFKFRCTSHYLGGKQAPSSKLSGIAIGNSGGSYSGGGNLVAKDYFRITSQAQKANSSGSNPNDFVLNNTNNANATAFKTLRSIISVEY